MGTLERHNVRVSGLPGAQPILFAHGFGCDQHMWRSVVPAFEAHYQVVLFDYLGNGGSDASAYDAERHATLDGYAADLLEIVDALDLHDVVFVGHSVSTMIGVLAALAEPERFSRLVLIGPSPRYIDDDGYVGGFSEDDITELLQSLESNYLGWSSAITPVIMGNDDRPELAGELNESFCRADPRIAAEFARVTFLSDNRADLPRVSVPTLVLQARNDAIAPVAVGEFVAEQIPDSRLVLLDATGHCPHLSAPDATTEAIREFLAGGAPVEGG